MTRKSNKPSVTDSDTGIYQQYSTYAGVDTHTPEALAAVAASIAKNWHFPTLAQELKRIYGNARIGKNDPLEHVRTEAQKLAIRKAADDLLASLFHLRQVIATGDIHAAVSCGIEVGTLDEQLRIRLNHEENAMTGRRSKVGHAKTGRAKTTEKETTYAKIQVWMQAYKKDHPAANDVRVKQKAVTEFDVSEDTIDRVIAWAAEKKT